MKKVIKSAIAFGALFAITASAGESKDLIADGGLENFKTYGKDSANPQWQIIDGELRLTEAGGGDLITRKEYENFDLTFEWKIPKKRNSGVFIGAKVSDQKIYQDAIEMQILGNTGFPRLDDFHIAGSVYGLSSSKREWAKPDGEWNKVRILKKGSKVQFYFNGNLTGDFDIASDEFAAKVAKSKFSAWPDFGKHMRGHIGFQDHGDSTGLAVRNLRIEELDAE